MEGTGERTEAFTYHGGNLAAAREAFPDAPRPWIDLSTGINGQPYTVGALTPEDFHRLPEPGAVAALESIAARTYGADPAYVIAAPGTQALIQILPRLAPVGRVGVLGMTYAEHGRVWGRACALVETIDTLEDLAGFDAAIVVNPNNPDGRLVAPERIAELAGRVGLLVVDEAFMDVAPRASSLVPALPPSRTIVLRSLGKFYGLAGVRLGFAIAGPDLGPALRTALGPWAVSGPAIALGGRALDDAEWRAATLERLRADAARLDRLLEQAGAEIVGGTPLFRLAKVATATAWFERLARSGILVRPFAERPGWLRFGIPAEDSQWARLAEALDLRNSRRARP